MVITERQKNELENTMENLNKEQNESIIAFGADMYRQGLIIGAITGAVGLGIGVSIQYVAKKIKNIRNK